MRTFFLTHTMSSPGRALAVRSPCALRRDNETGDVARCRDSVVGGGYLHPVAG